jgi:hypothetical protein
MSQIRFDGTHGTQASSRNHCRRVRGVRCGAARNLQDLLAASRRVRGVLPVSPRLCRYPSRAPEGVPPGSTRPQRWWLSRSLPLHLARSDTANDSPWPAKEASHRGGRSSRGRSGRRQDRPRRLKARLRALRCLTPSRLFSGPGSFSRLGGGAFWLPRASSGPRSRRPGHPPGTWSARSRRLVDAHEPGLAGDRDPERIRRLRPHWTSLHPQSMITNSVSSSTATIASHAMPTSRRAALVPARGAFGPSTGPRVNTIRDPDLDASRTLRLAFRGRPHQGARRRRC